MEYMSLINLVQYGTPAALLGLICVNIYQAVIISQLQNEIRDLKSSITWGKQCDERHDSINKRLDRIESTIFKGNK
jgi:predicted short-subunit dehydrogenase-like oxidoreductase (DUF2520 family)